jgi:hypothetical protein
VIPGQKAREYLRAEDPGVTWPRGGLTAGSLRWLVVYQALAAVALVIVVATLLVPQVAHSRSEARTLGFGYPLAFVSADLSTYTPPSYPQTYRFNPWETVAHVRPVQFVADWLLVIFALWTPAWLIRRRTA